MAGLIEINPLEHRELKIVNGADVSYAKSQHLLNIRVTEIDKAVSSFPVFFLRNPHSGAWAISALTSFNSGENLFVTRDSWDATYTPISMQTYPLFLIRSENNPKGYAIGLDPGGEAISKQLGEPLFEANGKESLFLSRSYAVLESDMRNEFLTRQFLQEMQQLEIIKPINIRIQYKDGSIQMIQGLHTADEDKVSRLGKEKLQDLNSRGYLVPIYATLISIYQLNGLIKRNNSIATNKSIDKIKVEIARSET